MSRPYQTTKTTGTSAAVTSISNAACTIFDCPACQSNRAGIVASSPPKAKCADCGKIYDIATIPPLSIPKPKRIAEPGKRHRRDNGPQVLEVKPLPPPNSAELGQSHLYTYQIIQGGPRALIAAEHEAARLSAKFGEEIETKWCLATPWLLKMAHGGPAPCDDIPVASNDAAVASIVASSDAAAIDPVSLTKVTRANRERARYALQWRPRFLAVVALTRSQRLAAVAAKVSRQVVRTHRRLDPDFDAQVMEAQDQAVELMHDVAMRRAIEGDCKPIYWQGIVVGHERVFSDKIQIEMLRAYKPDTFRTPGSKVNVNTGNQVTGNTFVVDTPMMLRLQAMRQESLRRIAEKMAQGREIASNDAKQAGTVPLAGVPPAT